VHVCVYVCVTLQEPILQFLISSLQQSQLATAAADALQCICSQCPDQMTAHFDSLVRIVTDVDSFDVSNDAAIGLLKGSRWISMDKFYHFTLAVSLHYLVKPERCLKGGLLVERRTSVSQIRGSIPGQVAAV